MTFARSITLPPPTATITSGSCSRPSATAASIAERGTSTAASANTATSPSSESRTVAKPGVSAMIGSVQTSTRRPCSAATRPAAGAMPTPNSTCDGARRTANSVIRRKFLTRSLNSSVRSSGVAWPQPPKMCIRASGSARNSASAVLERHDPVLDAVDQQDRHVDRSQLLLG